MEAFAFRTALATEVLIVAITPEQLDASALHLGLVRLASCKALIAIPR
jgi:hypothetical protein